MDSLGLLFWCLATRKEPYTEFTAFDPFFHAIVNEKKRPDMPVDILPRLKQLIEACWHPDPIFRPSCSEIVQTFYHIMIEAAISDEEGVLFWKRYYLDKTSIYWDIFIRAFCNTYIRISEFPTDKELKQATSYQLGEFASRNPGNKGLVKTEWEERHKDKDEIPPLPTKSELDSYIIYLKSILMKKKDDTTEVVDVEHFGLILSWFGPLKDPDGKCRLLERVKKK